MELQAFGLMITELKNIILQLYNSENQIITIKKTFCNSSRTLVK